MKFSNLVFTETWNHIGNLCGKKTEESSLCPETPRVLWCSAEFLTNAKSALAVLTVLPLCCPSTRNYFLISLLREHIGRMAENARYEGDWGVVREILTKTDSLSSYETWSIVLSNMNSNDWFGNFVPLLIQAIKALRWKRLYLSVMENHSPVRKPIRRGGYNDKGSSRPSHKWLPNRYPNIVMPKEKISIKEPSKYTWFFYLRRQGSD